MNRHRAYWSAMGSPKTNKEIDRDIARRHEIYKTVMAKVRKLTKVKRTKEYVCKKLIIELRKYSVVIDAPSVRAENALQKVKKIIFENSSELILMDNLQKYIIKELMKG